jgi:phage terminase large subunit-like protein
VERSVSAEPHLRGGGAYQARLVAPAGSKEDPPSCEYIICSLDAAAEKNNRADYTALTTWGVFLNEESDRYELILLDSIKERLEFPELKQLCYDHYSRVES